MRLAAKKILAPFSAAVIYILGKFLGGYWGMQFSPFCHSYYENGKVYCNSTYSHLGDLFVIVGEWLFLVAVILLFANERGTRWFFKFSIVYVPVAALLVASVPASSSAFLSFGPFQEGVARILGGLYALAALGIVLVARVRERA
jgi:hypothetical protein